MLTKKAVRGYRRLGKEHYTHYTEAASDYVVGL